MEREFQIHRTERDYSYAEFWKWSIAFMIGVAMGCIGFVVDWGIQLLNDAKFRSTVNVIVTRGTPSISPAAVVTICKTVTLRSSPAPAMHMSLPLQRHCN